MKAKKIIKICAICILALFAAILLTVGGYVIYVMAQYSRIEDKFVLEVQNNKEAVLEINTDYKIMSYNIGFGAYDREFSFFMDTGEMNDGTKTVGKYGKGVSKENVQKNTDGSLEIVKNAGADFYLLQEVDESSTRSYDINQRQAFSIDGYANTYAQNFHSAYLMYPFSDPHGAVRSGLLTLSKYKIESAVRRSFPVSDGFPDKFFDLDRCFSVHYIPCAGGKTLVLINLHMSAYDEGGTIRAEQLVMLNAIFEEELEKGNYVIAGGDFNHDIAGTADKFASGQKRPDWLYVLEDDDLALGMRFVGDSTAPSCRGADIPYEKGVNYIVAIDGFTVSQNIEVSIETLDNEFLYSDHNAVTMTFKLL